MTDLTKETVREAMRWGAVRQQYLITADDLPDRDMYHDADDVEKHAETLLTLVREMEKALRGKRYMACTEGCQSEEDGPDTCDCGGEDAYDEMVRVLALLPREA